MSASPPLPRTSTLVALIALLLLACAGRAEAKPVLGFAEGKPSMFADQRFRDLHVRNARLPVPWDVLSDPGTLPTLDAWMAGAKHDHVQPLLTFERSRQPGRTSKNPSQRQMTTLVRKLRKRYPGQVRYLSTWNEANINKRPQLVAGWYRAIQKGCRSCTVLGADLVDKPNLVGWAKRFVRAAHRTPKAWGLHNYVDVNNLTAKRTLRFAKRVKGDIWLTETGGVLDRSNPGSHFKGTGDAHAKQATRYLLRHLITLKALRHRIRRVYLYSWSTAANEATWDSGMIGPDGTERSMLTEVRHYLHRKRIDRPATPPPPSGVVLTPAE